MATARAAHFQPSLFRFLGELAAHNERDWFNSNKPRYESDVKEPVLRFISDFSARLAKISKHYVADPRPVGGSMMRIYRDTRFAKDKSPYKTNVGVGFHHGGLGKDEMAPGFYLHLEPGSVFVGSGLWHPEPKALAKIRDALVEDPARWKKILAEKKFKASCTVGGETLKRPPQGYDPQHALIEDLKRKDFITSMAFTDKQVTAPDFIDRFADACAINAPFVRFLCDALQISF